VKGKLNRVYTHLRVILMYSTCWQLVTLMQYDFKPFFTDLVTVFLRCALSHCSIWSYYCMLLLT